MTAIERRDSRGFVNQTILYAAVFALSAFTATIYRFTEDRLGVWREWFTRRLTGIPRMISAQTAARRQLLRRTDIKNGKWEHNADHRKGAVTRSRLSSFW